MPWFLMTLKMLTSLWLGLSELFNGIDSKASYRPWDCPRAQLDGSTGTLEQTGANVTVDFCFRMFSARPLHQVQLLQYSPLHGVFQAGLLTCVHWRASASDCWLRPCASPVLPNLSCRRVPCTVGIASDGAELCGGSAAEMAGTGPNCLNGLPQLLRSCAQAVQASLFVSATSGSLMKASVAAQPMACPSTCLGGVSPPLSGLSEPMAGDALPVPAAWCKVRLRWDPQLLSALTVQSLKRAYAGDFVFRHPQYRRASWTATRPVAHKAFLSSWLIIADSAAAAARRCSPACSKIGVAPVCLQSASNCYCYLLLLRPASLGDVLPCRNRHLCMLCMVRALLPRLISLCSVITVLSLTRQQQDTAATVANGLPCICPFLGRHGLPCVFFARTLGLAPQPAVGMAPFQAASSLQALTACLPSLLRMWLSFFGGRLTGCTGPTCDGLRWVALLMGVRAVFVWRLRRACSARYMLHRLCVGQYRRRRLWGSDFRDWRLALQRKRACGSCQPWTHACLLCAACYRVYGGTRFLCCVLLKRFLWILVCLLWASVFLRPPAARSAPVLARLYGLGPRPRRKPLPRQGLHRREHLPHVLALSHGLCRRRRLAPGRRQRPPEPPQLDVVAAPPSPASVTRRRAPVGLLLRRLPPAALPIRPLRRWSWWSNQQWGSRLPSTVDGPLAENWLLKHKPRLLRSRSGPRQFPRLRLRCLTLLTAMRLLIGLSGAGALPHQKCLCVLAIGVLPALAFFAIVGLPAKAPNSEARRALSRRFGCPLSWRSILSQMCVASCLPHGLRAAVTLALQLCKMSCSCFCARLAQHSLRVFYSISSSISAGGFARTEPVCNRLQAARARLAAMSDLVQTRQAQFPFLRFRCHQSYKSTDTHRTGVSPAGPKSGTSSRMCLSPRWLGALLFMTLAFGARGARVAGGVATPAGAEQRLPAGTRQSAKHSDEQVSLSGPRKRAFRRAQNRATRDGATWYRGRWLTRQQLQAADGRTLRAKAARPAAAPHNAHKHARTVGRLAAWPPEPSSTTGSTFRKGSCQLSVFSLNIGSFTTEVYDEFCRWLELPSTLASIDVIFVQETWRGSSDYQLPGWSWIASGQKPLAGQGVAVLVNRQLADSAAIRFREVRVGRILHVQVPLRGDSQGRLLNLLCVYVPAKISESKQVYEKRAAVWHALDAVLQALPSRHVLCVAGDFNTDLLQDPPLVGTTYMHKGKVRTAAQDQPLFQNLLRTHGLHALNTWSNQGTYVDPHGPTSRVDFLLTRTLQAAGHRVAAQPQMRFASWRAGARHLPLLGLIDLKVWCRFRDRTPALPPIDLEALCRACRPGAELEMLRQAFLARQHLFTAELPPFQAEAELRTLCAEVFPLRRHRTIMLQWQQPEVGQDLQLTWQLRSRLKQLAGRWPHLSSVFRVWQHHARLVRRVKELKRNSRRRRREHWQQQLAEAEQAGQTRNPLKFFQVVQRLAPKRDQTRVQIRDKAGHILTPDQEDRALAEYWTGIYSSSRMARQPAILRNPVLLSPHELQDALRGLKQRKAVARGMAPAAAWKALASPLSHYLSEVLEAMWQPGRLYIPVVWTQSDLHFLPKPQITTKRPQDLRPIALQSAAAKAVTTVFKHRLSPSFQEAMRGLPQYAYTANRSTQEGIARVAAHCAAVRDLVRTQTLNIFDRYAGAKYSPCLGAPSSALIFQRPLTFFLGRPCRPCSRKLIYLRMNGKYCWSGTRQAGTEYRAEVVRSLSLSSWTVVFDKAASCPLHCGGCSPSAFSSV